jgi:hypothetical protein
VQHVKNTKIQKVSQTLFPYSGIPSVGLQACGMAGHESGKIQNKFCEWIKLMSLKLDSSVLILLLDT